MTATSRPAATSSVRNGAIALKGVDAAEFGNILANAADLALVLDKNGVVRDVIFGADDLANEGYSDWLGRPWIDTVTIESRPKVKELLAGAPDRPRFREVNHPSRNGLDVPIRYSAIRAGKSGGVIALGRDLRAVSMLQQRLVEAQQAMEREYARLRLAETRYRMLFNLGAEPVVIVEGASQRVVEANPAAQKLIGGPAGLPAGGLFPGFFDGDSSDAVSTLLKNARMAGRAGEIDARAVATKHPFKASASLFRQDNAPFLLVRLSPQTATQTGMATGMSASIMEMTEHLPDGFVVTSPEMKILEANRAFLELAELSTKDQAIGHDLGEWLGRQGVDLPLLMSNLAEYGTVRGFSTFVQGTYGGMEEVEVSAVPALTGETPCYGFILRSTGARDAAQGGRARALTKSVEHLAELVGRTSLKEIVRDTTDVIEKLCIEAALELSGDNRASSAQMLGLSRQSLYAKMRRHSLGGLDENDV